MPQLQITNLTKTFPLDGTSVNALKDVNLTVEKSEFISVVGHSGSGKTTLLSIIGGIQRPTSGTVLFDDENIYRLDETGLAAYRASRIGYVFQFASLMPVLTARENVLLPTVFAHGQKQAGARAANLLDLVGLKDKVNAYPYQLSGGQRRRVAIARAVMNNPEMVLADEPTGDLDEQTESEIMDLFVKINREFQTTFIIVTHSTDLARMTHKIFRMAGGVLDPNPTVIA
ncbi:MAG: ABC transporter ATP-binding protein [Actinomycetota bacterium]|nr:ABC transporter ATP-binding protein [Actinomycetota bacterium]